VGIVTFTAIRLRNSSLGRPPVALLRLPHSRPGWWASGCTPLGYGVNSLLDAVFILVQLGMVLAFLVIVTYSKHLHIGLGPLNVMFSRRPNALGPLVPMRSGGKVLDCARSTSSASTTSTGCAATRYWSSPPSPPRRPPC
jgi:hypothetical protein